MLVFLRPEPNPPDPLSTTRHIAILFAAIGASTIGSSCPPAESRNTFFSLLGGGDSEEGASRADTGRAMGVGMAHAHGRAGHALGAREEVCSASSACRLVCAWVCSKVASPSKARVIGYHELNLFDKNTIMRPSCGVHSEGNLNLLIGD
ncbi:hypothetical protein SEVIR_3G411300v4 [Setaria viridis]|uniref:Uncharacterized protein n=1 Tax=Setaria viridis TaxID=4556 RepID=A0A4V6DAI9_SETVI|nr:hypothetical protein SEVIR_3G411300v2 [Setaria viridis]